MKKAIVTILFVVFAATGCSVDAPNAIKATPNTVVAAVTTTTTTMTIEEARTKAFLYLVRRDIPNASSVNDDTLIGLGQSVCEALNSGNSLDAVGEIFLAQGWSAEDAGSMIGFSNAAYCPEYNG